MSAARGLRRRAFLGLLAAGALFGSNAFAGTYLNSAALLLAQANSEADFLRARVNDKELAELVHRLAEGRLDAAKNMLVPKEVVQAHPHLLLVLENYERAADSATRGEAEKFLVYQQRARDEDRTFRGVLKQFGYTLPDVKP
ncbi:MAG TPA: hypothetical protein VHV51_24575 [Polyangiaceae bacterium]|jgi:hypothetical protein|nr:hypothetical protein [Polyangiaceae bacterium]